MGDEGARNSVVDAGHLESVNASIRQGEIDGSARFAGASPGVRTGFIQRDLKAPPLEEYGEERARRTRADDVHGAPDVRRRRAHGAIARLSASTAAKTSLYEL